MAKKAPVSMQTVDELLKASFVLARTVDHILETRAVESATSEPLSSSKIRILRLLGNRGDQTSSQVARHLGVSKPAVSQIVDTMVAAKLVVRKSGVRDRREVNLHLTAKGKTCFKAILQQQRHHLRNALRQSKIGDANKWISSMRDIATSLAQADKAFTHFCLQCGAHADGSCVLDGGDAHCLFLQHKGELKAKKTGATAKRRAKSTRSAPAKAKKKKRKTARR